MKERDNLSEIAVKINGEYIEDIIPGYKTMNVIGWWSVERELETEENHEVGVIVKEEYYPPRELIVEFSLEYASYTEARAKHDRLIELLSIKDATVTINAETDKECVGTPIVPDFEYKRNKAKGEFRIFCPDPFKYSVDWHSPAPVVAEDPETGLYQTFRIDYEGTRPAYPQYIAKIYNPDGDTDEDNAEFDQTDMAKNLDGVGACKFVAFMDDENHVLQFGNPNLEDTSDVPDPLELNYRSFQKKGSYDPLKSGEEWVSPAVGYSLLEQSIQQGSIETAPAIYNPTQQTITKDQTLLSKTSGTSCQYTAYVTKVSGRTPSKVTLSIQVKMSDLKEDIGKGATLTVEVTHGTKTVTKILKKSSVAWKKKTAHSCSFTMLIDAGSATTEISGLKIRVARQNGSYKYKDGNTTKTKKATGSAGNMSTKTCKTVLIPIYIPVDADKSYYLKPVSYGNPVSKKYTGPTLTWRYPSSGLPATDDGVGAAYFNLDWTIKFCMGKTTNETLQMGAFECIVLTGDSMDANGVITNPKALAAVKVNKENTSGKGSIRLYAGGKQVYQGIKEVDLTWAKGLLGSSKGSVACSIRTAGGAKKAIEFKLGNVFGGKSKSFVLPADMATKRAYKIVFGFYRYSASPPFDFNGLRGVRITKMYSEKSELESVPFRAAQTLVADSRNYEVTLDGLPRPDLGALGNDWEQMCLMPGINDISTAFLQRPEDAIKVIRRCRDDEPYRGISVYNTDDEGNPLDVDEDGRDVIIYYAYNGAAGGEPDDSVFFYEAETEVDGKRVITASGISFIETEVAPEQFDADTESYFVLEDPVPSFEINYREVYL